MNNFGFQSREEALSQLNSETPDEIKKFYNSSFEITNSQVRQYQQNGFIKLKNVVLSEHLNYIKRIIEASVFLRKESDKITFAEKSNYEQSFLQCGYLCFDFPVIKDFVFSKRFAGIANELMRTEGTRLWHDQALFKETGVRATPVHQDSSYWPLQNPDNSTTMWLSLNGANRENGCLYFYPKTHKTEKEYVDIFKNPHSPKHLKKLEKEFIELNPGDATFHSGLTFHGTKENRTETIREGMTVIYIDDGNKFDDSDERNRTHKSCIGLNHGQIINTQYTPKLI